MNVTVWRWEVKDTSRRSGWRRFSWMMTEEGAAQWAATNKAELRKVEGSREERRDVSGNARVPDASRQR